MGYSARQNETARQAASGKLMSRATIMGKMDHALETHASALRLLEARIVALKERIERLEGVLAPNDGARLAVVFDRLAEKEANVHPD